MGAHNLTFVIKDDAEGAPGNEAGGGETEKSLLCPNTINGYDASWWRRKGPNPGMYRGEVAKSGALRCQQVGATSKSDEEIQEFNATYLAENPTYSLVGANCQDYVIDLVSWLVGSVDGLPSREVVKYGAAVGGVGLLGALAGAWWMFGQRGQEKEEEKRKKAIDSSSLEAR